MINLQKHIIRDIIRFIESVNSTFNQVHLPHLFVRKYTLPFAVNVSGCWVPLTLSDAVLAAQAVKHDANLVFGREMLPGLPAGCP